MTTITERAAKVLQEIDAALALAEKATQGPWTINGDFIDQSENGYPVAVTRSGRFLPEVTDSEMHRHNAALIAASRTLLPASLQMLKTAIGGLRGAIGFEGCATALATICDQWEARS